MYNIYDTGNWSPMINNIKHMCKVYDCIFISFLKYKYNIRISIKWFEVFMNMKIKLKIENYNKLLFVLEVLYKCKIIKHDT